MAAIGTCICAKSCATFLPIQALYLDPFFFRLLIRCHQGTSMRPLDLFSSLADPSFFKRRCGRAINSHPN
jgi:hypothetical protein